MAKFTAATVGATWIAKALKASIAVPAALVAGTGIGAFKLGQGALRLGSAQNSIKSGWMYRNSFGQAALVVGAGTAAVGALAAGGYMLSGRAEDLEPREKLDPLDRQERQVAMMEQMMAEEQERQAAYAQTFANVNAESAGMTQGKAPGQWQANTGRTAPAQAGGFAPAAAANKTAQQSAVPQP